MILNTKNHLLIAKYIVETKNFNLLNIIYETFENLSLCCFAYNTSNDTEEKYKKILLEEIKILKSESVVFEFNDKIDNYVNEKGYSKKINNEKTD